jgi:eukaryotic-like serine/threonine-protein kinase
MAEVWAAHDTDLSRRVALKFLGDGADRLRFAREAHAAANLSHPNICQLYAYGEGADRPYLVLEFLAGGTLEERLAAGERFSDADVAKCAVELASALAHAHGRGVVHRDVKPANVLFDSEGRAKLSDFGIARVADRPTLTEAGTLLGSAAYISPEQAQGKPLTPTTDVYAFGVILYRLLTGRLPFEADDPLALAAMHVRKEPSPLLSLRPDAPRDLERVATAALAKQPERRPADGDALLAALTSQATALPTPTSVATDAPTSVITPRKRFAETRGLRALMGAVLAILAAAGAGLAMLTTPEESNAPVTPTGQRTSTSNRVETRPADAPADRPQSRRSTTRSSVTMKTATAATVQSRSTPAETLPSPTATTTEPTSTTIPGTTTATTPTDTTEPPPTATSPTTVPSETTTSPEPTTSTPSPSFRGT